MFAESVSCAHLNIKMKREHVLAEGFVGDRDLLGRYGEKTEGRGHSVKKGTSQNTRQPHFCRLESSLKSA